MKPLIRIFAFVSFAWISVVHANVAPDVLVKETTDKVLGELNANQEKFSGDQPALFQLVDEIVLPHFDFRLMSRLVLGKYWKKATVEQREQFVVQFKALLVRTYATALFEYTGQEIVYKPFRMKTDTKKAVVKTEIVPVDGPKIPLNYSLSKRSDNAWRVFDIRIDGISLVTNYRAAYGQAIRAKGMEALISSLVEKNAAP